MRVASMLYCILQVHDFLMCSQLAPFCYFCAAARSCRGCLTERSASTWLLYTMYSTYCTCLVPWCADVVFVLFLCVQPPGPAAAA
jgi:hypothetical protein